MKFGITAQCLRHKCDLGIEDYDISLEEIPGVKATRWVISITGWYCPVAREKEEYRLDTNEIPHLVCESGWWAIQ